jgi:hypothetical protein
MPISMNMAIIRLIKRIKDVGKAEDKALARIKETVKKIYITEEDTREVKKIEYFDRSATFTIN